VDAVLALHERANVKNRGGAIKDRSEHVDRRVGVAVGDVHRSGVGGLKAFG